MIRYWKNPWEPDISANIYEWIWESAYNNNGINTINININYHYWIWILIYSKRGHRFKQYYKIGIIFPVV